MSEQAKVIPLFTPAGGTHEAYKLDPEFEHALVYRLCSNPKMWARVGRYIDSKALGDAAATLAVDAVVAIVAETGRPAADVRQVHQRLSTWQSEGKITIDMRIAVKRYIAEGHDEADAHGGPIEGVDEWIVDEMKPVLQRRLRREAARSATHALSNRGDMTDVAKLIEDAQKVGEVAGGAGATRVGVNSLVDLSRALSLDRSGTGILEVDTELRGGMPYGLGAYIGFLGKGKSTSLVHTAVANALKGHVVMALTGELTKEQWEAKVLANLFGVPVSAILEEKSVRVALQDRIEELSTWLDTSFRLSVEWFEPNVDTTRTLIEKVDAEEQRTGQRVDVVAIDYADKVKPNKPMPKDDKGYFAAGNVYESLRLWTVETKRWTWTATQATRDKKRKKIDAHDISDSIEKGRVLDLLISINPTDDTITWGVAKFRHGKDGQSIGPIPHDFACSRVAPVVAELYPDPGLEELPTQGTRMGGTVAATLLGGEST